MGSLYLFRLHGVAKDFTTLYFKTNETTNQYRCTLVDADDGFPWCSTLTDQNGEHVGGVVSLLHLDDGVDIVVIIIA